MNCNHLNQVTLGWTFFKYLFDLYRLRTVSEILIKYDSMIFLYMYFFWFIWPWILFMDKFCQILIMEIIKENTFSPININKHAWILYIKYEKFWKRKGLQAKLVNFFVWFSDSRLQLYYWKSFVYIIKCVHAEIFIETS